MSAADVGDAACCITVADEPVVLLPSRALWIPSQRLVCVADLHWGKAAAFRAAHVPVPTGGTHADLTRLTAILQHTAASHLVILGDLLHDRSGRHEDTMHRIASWRAQHAAIHITLVRGNHDRHAGDPPSTLNIKCVNAPYRMGPFVGVHEPETDLEYTPALDAPGYVLAGHLHPHVTIRGRGRQALRLPAFVVGTQRAVLPAFSSFTGGGMYTRQPGDALYGIADEQVIPLTRS